MNKLLLAVLLIAPLFASSNTLQFNALGDNFKFKNYNLSPNTTEDKVGHFGSFITVGNAGSRFSVNYLALASKSDYNNNDQKPSFGKQVSHQNTLDIANLDNGAYKTIPFKNRGKPSSVLSLVVLRDINGGHQSTTNAGFNNHSHSASFDFVAEFNNSSNSNNRHSDTNVNAPSAVPTPAALPLLATAIGLFGFAANRRRV